MGTRVFQYRGSPVPFVLTENTKRGLTFKLPSNLLQPKDLLRAKQKDKTNAAKLADEVRRTKALEAERARRERLESQARFAAMLKAERERQASQPVALLSAFEANDEAFVAKPRRGPGARGTASASNNMVALPKPTRTIPPNLLRMMHGLPKALEPKKENHPNVVKLLTSLATNKTVRKANLLKAQRAAEKAAGAGAGTGTSKPMGKFWKKEGTNNSNSSNSD